jgi:hypothetical protein
MKEIFEKYSILLSKDPKTALSIPPIICFITFILIEFTIFCPLASYNLNILESEIAKITPPGEAIFLKERTNNKFSQAAASEYYYIDWNALEVFNYYHKGLVENGWSYKRQNIVPYQSVGQIYCKDKYTLHLDYYEKRYEEQYTILIWWGIPSECDTTNYILYFHNTMFVCYCVSFFIVPIILGFTFIVNRLRKKSTYK